MPPRTGEIVGDSPDRRVEILSDDESLNVTWSRFGPYRDGADLHIHREHTDLFYVLDGELTIRLGPEGREVAVPAGTLVRVPPLVVHGFRNTSDAEVTYLNIHAPGKRFADYMRARRDGIEFSYDQFDPPEDGGRDPSEAAIGGGRDGVLADVPHIRIRLRSCEGGDAAVSGADPSVTSFYVLEGELAVTAGDHDMCAEAGSWLQVPPGVEHSVAGAARFLELRTPNNP